MTATADDAVADACWAAARCSASDGHHSGDDTAADAVFDEGWCHYAAGEVAKANLAAVPVS